MVAPVSNAPSLPAGEAPILVVVASPGQTIELAQSREPLDTLVRISIDSNDRDRVRALTESLTPLAETYRI